MRVELSASNFRLQMVLSLSTLSWLSEELQLPVLLAAVNKMTANGSVPQLSRLVQPIPETVDSIGKRLLQFGQKINERLDLPHAVNNVKTYAGNNPGFTLILAILGVMCALPILAFACFVVVTLGLTFMGFIFIEGTLLTVGTFLLSGVLFVVGFFALGFSAFVAAAWFFVSKAYNVVSLASDRLSTIRPHGVKSSRSSAAPAPIGNGLHHSD